MQKESENERRRVLVLTFLFVPGPGVDPGTVSDIGRNNCLYQGSPKKTARGPPTLSFNV